MASEWIDFKKLRAQLPFRDVLAAYGVEPKVKGDQHQGFCPLPTHTGSGKKSPSFSANLKRGIFKCFGCGAGGNVLDFAARMSNRDPSNAEQLQQTALELAERFKIELPQPRANTSRRNREQAQTKPLSRQSVPAEQDNMVVNAPLDFTLKELDPDHPYLRERGFSPDTIRHFGLGFCNRGLLAGRIAIGLHDTEGRLVGYAGRLTKDAEIDYTKPKYLFPPRREHEGKIYEMRKSLLVYNLHRIAAPARDLVVVEGFPSVWHFTQLGKSNVVATMGASCSEEQARLITSRVHPTGRLWLLTDGDDAGDRFGVEAAPRLARHRLCRWLRLDDGKQPTDYASDTLRTLITNG